jgi:hypothetical protein
LLPRGRKLKCSRCQKVFFQPAPLPPAVPVEEPVEEAVAQPVQDTPEVQDERAEEESTDEGFTLAALLGGEQTATDEEEDPFALESRDHATEEVQDDGSESTDDAMETLSDTEEDWMLPTRDDDVDEASQDEAMSDGRVEPIMGDTEEETAAGEETGEETADEFSDFSLEELGLHDPDEDDLDRTQLADVDDDERTQIAGHDEDRDGDMTIESAPDDRWEDPLASLAVPDDVATITSRDEETTRVADLEITREMSVTSADAVMPDDSADDNRDDDVAPQPEKSAFSLEKWLWGAFFGTLLTGAGYWGLATHWFEYKWYDWNHTLRMESISSRWRASMDGGRILIVEGKLTNTDRISQKPQMVHVTMVDRDNKPVLVQKGVLDRVLSEQDLASSDATLERMLALQQDITRVSPRKIPPGRTMPFQVVVLNPPANGHRYQVHFEDLPMPPVL